MGPELDPRDHLPWLKEHEAREEILHPRRVAAAKEWQPLLQALHDSGIAAIISERTLTQMPRLEIINRIYRHGIGGEIIAEVVPREEEVNVFAISSPAYREPMSTAWSVHVVVSPQEEDQFDSTLRLEATRVPQWTSPEPYTFTGRQNKVSFEIDQNRNLRVVGDQEYFNGSIDDLNKRGLNRVRAAINRAFRHPAVSPGQLGFMTLGAA